MPLDFTPTSVVKAAKRTFTVPITTAATFDANIAALTAADNPLGATAYQTAGASVDGVTVANEYYKATIAYLNPLGEVIGAIVIDAPTRSAYDAVVAHVLADDALTAKFAADAVADRDNTKDSWNVRLKIHDPTGEIYFLSFTRKDLKISSYESDAILAKVEEWADAQNTLN
ncbi:hypothetical protein [Methanorbis furvi]|uniref:Uncharacterized protein n=1 Tax=Methanorbis furvi TaxID=3028299 RepID=A0AAE4MDD2_9EURY|nr:hypothetical protein [Methanocorpusculaceae archaeon Ag1]